MIDKKIIPLVVHPLDMYKEACKKEIQDIVNQHYANSLVLHVNPEDNEFLQQGIYINASDVIPDELDNPEYTLFDPTVVGVFSNVKKLEMILMGGETTPDVPGDHRGGYACHYAVHKDISHWFCNQEVTEEMTIHIPFDATFTVAGRVTNTLSDRQDIIVKHSNLGETDMKMGSKSVMFLYKK